MAKLLSIDDLQRILGAHQGRLSRCVWPAWDRYFLIAQADRLSFDKTAEAKVINRYIIDGVKKEFAGVPGISFLSYDLIGIEGFPFGIEESVVCRFKKLNDAGRSRAYPTRRAQALLTNDTDDLFGVPDKATIVDIGPVINEFHTAFRDVQAIRVKDLKFIMSFPNTATGYGNGPSSLPFTPPNSGTPRFTIVPRREVSGDTDPEKK